MNLDSLRRQRLGRPAIFAGVAAVALVGGAGVGYAATHSGSNGAPTSVVAAGPAASASPSASGGNGQPPAIHKGARGLFGVGGLGLGPRAGLAGGVVHGQVTVPKSGGGYQTLDIQTGKVTAVNSTSITVKSADGFSASYAVTSNTLVNAKSAGIGSVKNGDTVSVIATVSGSTATAARVFDQTAIKSGRASFGFPFHRGKMKPGIPAPSSSPNT